MSATTDTRFQRHAAVTGRVDGQSLVFAPVGGRGRTNECKLVALDDDGGRELLVMYADGRVVRLDYLE